MSNFLWLCPFTLGDHFVCTMFCVLMNIIKKHPHRCQKHRLREKKTKRQKDKKTINRADIIVWVTYLFQGKNIRSWVNTFWWWIWNFHQWIVAVLLWNPPPKSTKWLSLKNTVILSNCKFQISARTLDFIENIECCYNLSWFFLGGGV